MNTRLQKKLVASFGNTTRRRTTKVFYSLNTRGLGALDVNVCTC